MGTLNTVIRPDLKPSKYLKKRSRTHSIKFHWTLFYAPQTSQFADNPARHVMDYNLTTYQKPGGS